MLSGTLIQGMCWCIVLILSLFYTYHRAENRWDATWPVDRPLNSRCWPFTPGLARVLCIPCVILSAVGWCVYWGEANLYHHWPTFYTSPHFIIPPLAYLAALLHAGCSGGASTVMGAITAILNMLFLSFVGSITISFALDLQSRNCNTWYNTCYYDKIILGGGITCLFFGGCVLALWPFYRKHPPPVHHDIIERKGPPRIL